MGFKTNEALTTHVIWTQLMESVNITHQIQYTRNKVEEKSQIPNFSKHVSQFLQGEMAGEVLEWVRCAVKIWIASFASTWMDRSYCPVCDTFYTMCVTVGWPESTFFLNSYSSAGSTIIDTGWPLYQNEIGKIRSSVTVRIKKLLRLCMHISACQP